MGPPEEVVADDGPEGKGLLLYKGEVGEEVFSCVDGGSVSQDRVRKQDCRMIEKELGAKGSWVEV